MRDFIAQVFGRGNIVGVYGKLLWFGRLTRDQYLTHQQNICILEVVTIPYHRCSQSWRGKGLNKLRFHYNYHGNRCRIVAVCFLKEEMMANLQSGDYDE